MREKLRRMSVIVYLLKIKPHTYNQLHSRLNYIMMHHYSRSIIEKDVAMLREEFDCPIEISINRNGIVILEDYDFINSIAEWVQIYE